MPGISLRRGLSNVLTRWRLSSPRRIRHSKTGTSRAYGRTPDLWLDPSGLIAFPAAVSRLRGHPVGDLVGRKLLAAGTQGPVMPEWVADDAVTLAPEHFSNRHFHLCAHLDGMGESSVDIVELEQQQDGGAAQRGRG